MGRNNQFGRMNDNHLRMTTALLYDEEIEADENGVVEIRNKYRSRIRPRRPSAPTHNNHIPEKEVREEEEEDQKQQSSCYAAEPTAIEIMLARHTVPSLRCTKNNSTPRNWSTRHDNLANPYAQTNVDIKTLSTASSSQEGSSNSTGTAELRIRKSFRERFTTSNTHNKANKEPVEETKDRVSRGVRNKQEHQDESNIGNQPDATTTVGRTRTTASESPRRSRSKNPFSPLICSGKAIDEEYLRSQAQASHRNVSPVLEKGTDHENSRMPTCSTPEGPAAAAAAAALAPVPAAHTPNSEMSKPFSSVVTILGRSHISELSLPNLGRSASSNRMERSTSVLGDAAMEAVRKRLHKVEQELQSGGQLSRKEILKMLESVAQSVIERPALLVVEEEDDFKSNNRIHQSAKRRPNPKKFYSERLMDVHDATVSPMSRHLSSAAVMGRRDDDYDYDDDDDIVANDEYTDESDYSGSRSRGDDEDDDDYLDSVCTDHSAEFTRWISEFDADDSSQDSMGNLWGLFNFAALSSAKQEEEGNINRASKKYASRRKKSGRSRRGITPNELVKAAQTVVAGTHIDDCYSPTFVQQQQQQHLQVCREMPRVPSSPEAALSLSSVESNQFQRSNNVKKFRGRFSQQRQLQRNFSARQEELTIPEYDYYTAEV